MHYASSPPLFLFIFSEAINLHCVVVVAVGLNNVKT